MKRFSLRLSEAEYIKLKLYSEEIQVSMNDVIRDLIRNWHPRAEILEKVFENEKKRS